MLLILLHGLVAVSSGAATELAHVSEAFAAPRYTQEIRFDFATAEDAARAEVRLAPLYDDYERAISNRWDDNNEGTLEARNRMNAHGVKGTFYLHGPGGSYHYQGDFLPIARQLQAGGHSIGGHGLTHPYITYVNRNRMFEETAGVRIFWETALDTPVCSYAFSFVNYRSDAEGDLVQRDLVQSLERAGFYHVATFVDFMEALPCDLMFSPIMPPENSDLDTFKRAVDWAVSNDELKEKHPCISNSMHAWYGSSLLPQYGWDELDRRLEYLCAVGDFWRCNQNEYAAYRYQFTHTEVEKVAQEGNTLHLKLSRPVVDFLNDRTPLTLTLTGVAPDSVVSVSCPTALIESSKRAVSGKGLFTLHHNREQRLPVHIGATDNADGRTALGQTDTDADFPKLRALLSFDGVKLTLRFESLDERPVNNLRYTVRLPIGWESGVLHGRWGDQAAHQGVAVAEWTPTVNEAHDKAHVGTAYFVAQLDFDLGDAPGRLYATCHYALPEDASFPRDGFVVMGPIPPAAFDLDAFAKAVAEKGGAPTTWTDTEGQWTPWRDNRNDGEVQQEHLDFEVVRTQADWFKNTSPVYLLRSIVQSPTERAFEVAGVAEDLKAVFVNGVPLTNMRGMLRAGDNELLIVHHPEIPPGNPRHFACFLRLSDVETGARLRDIIYRMPEVKEVPTVLTVALLQMMPDENNQEANLAKAVAFCREAAAKGADIALFPEMFNIGYTPFQGTGENAVQTWIDQAVGHDSDYINTLRDLARELDMAIAATYLEAYPGGPRNSLTLIDRHGEMRYTYGKVHTCDFAAFEAACTPGEDWYVAPLDTKCGPVQVGAMICYDREFPESARTLMIKGAEIVLTPNACPLDDVRLHQFQTRAYENSMAMFMTNYPAPLHGGRSVAYGVQGEPIVEAPAEEGVYLVRVDLAGLREFRKRTIWGNSFRRPHRYGALTQPGTTPVWNRIDGFGKPYDPSAR